MTSKNKKMITPIFLLILLFQSINATESSDFTIKEATIQEIQTSFKRHKLTSKNLVLFYIEEIRKVNPIFRAVIELNPDAICQAEKADEERNANAPKSSFGLHGIPVLLKDNIGTKDKLNTTAGSYALLKSVVPRDAGVVKKLREAVAIILGKASLSEWAHFRSSLAPNGWNARAKQAVELLEQYPQDFFLAAEKTNGIGKLEKEALLNLTRASRYGFEKLMKENKLDALVTPYSDSSTVLGIGGYPGISVPAGYDKSGAPYGICFGGLKGSEPTLIEIAYGFEQATMFRKPPPMKDQL